MMKSIVKRLLRVGEIIQKEDEAYTWNTPECVEMGWVKVYKESVGKEYVVGMVDVRRDVTADSSRKDETKEDNYV